MLEQSASWEAAGDRRAAFLQCYALMTGNMLQAVGAGRFDDPLWVDRLLHLFADYYFDALAQYETAPSAAPAVWRHAHGATLSRDLHVLQCLLLGINAHINYDLALALRDMLAPEWAQLSESQKLTRYQDHRTVNAIIAETIDTVQDQIIEKVDPRMDLIDRVMGRLDEKLLSGLISQWREDVWEDAQNLLRTVHAESERRKIEAKTLKRAELMVWV